MDDDIWLRLREFSEAKLGCLRKVAKRSGLVGLARNDHFPVTLEGRTFYVVARKFFYKVLNETLIDATEQFPQSFGANDPEKVLKALYDVYPYLDFESFKKLLHEDQFALVIEFTGDQINDKMLRIELYRLIHDNSPVFTGGLLHAFNHFSYNGVPLSTGKGECPIGHPQKIFNYFIKAFFLNNFTPREKENEYESIVPFDDHKSIKIGFHLQPDCQVYFINTVHIIKQKNTTT